MGLVIAVATMASYAVAWWIFGLEATGHGSRPGDAAGFVPLVLLLGVAWWRMRDDSPERRRERAKRGYTIGMVTGLQGVLILLTVYVLGLLHRADLLAPIVAIIMGIHFLAFARLFPAWLYYLTSALLVLTGVVGLVLDPGAGRVLAVSMGAAGILWLTCVAVLVWPESRRQGA